MTDKKKPEPRKKTGFGQTKKVQPDGHDCLKHLEIRKNNPPTCRICQRPL